MKQFDAIVIGSGQGGTPLAKKLAKAGWQTALIEKRAIGGTCINDGCTPTKAMIASAKAAYTIQNSASLGVFTQPAAVDIKKIVARKNEIVRSFRESSEKSLRETANLTLIEGEAFFSGKKLLTVNLRDGGTAALSADKIFLNVGATTNIPPVEGLKNVPYYTSTTLLDVEEIPRHLVILGGNYIGLEYGQMFKRFGSQVTILERSARILLHEDEDIAQSVKEILEQEDIHIHTNSSAQKIIQHPDHTLEITFTTNDTINIITASHLLVATGRTPQTAALQLHKTGVDMDDKGYIRVNDQLETNVPGIYALGDVKGGPAFTHISYNDYIILSENLLEHAGVSIKDRPVPYCMFTDPQLGRIGLTEQAAREKGYAVKVALISMDKVARAIETGQTQGCMKAVVNADTDELLGAAILGSEGGEVMSVLQMAMQGHITCKQLKKNVFAHPLYAESINNLFMKLDK
ncbi:mercuric reductase [Chitinophaga defluvii]|uniref:Mercuric reductase n=1 Tax=Chitinophaga defluvii TaxID=3163343 RepID=A0ABV2T5V0_9BACT